MASSVTETPPTYSTVGINKLILDVTFDTNGSFTATELTHKINGYLLALETNPGSTAPTDNYDITLIDEEGLDVLQGAGTDRDTTNTEMAAIALDSYFHPPVTRDQSLTLTITGNTVDSATVRIIIYYEKVER
jgi:hypothetical protein